MVKKKIFIDGSHGTTGLELQERLQKIPTITLIEIPYHLRKDKDIRKKCYAKADLVVLCLPDQESDQAVKIISELEQEKSSPNKNSFYLPKILDTSSHFRIHPDWIYGHPQLFPTEISCSPRVTNPGCYAIGFITLVYPLIKHKWIRPHETLTVFGGSGYSGGGKKMIQDYQSSKVPPFLPYALDLEHKHIPEMKQVSGLKKPPLFLPLVGNYYRGMLVMLTLPYSQLQTDRDDFLLKSISKKKSNNFKNFYKEFYKHSEKIKVKEIAEIELFQNQFLSPLVDDDDMEIIITSRSNGDSILFARFDNLGKGAAGNALENIRLMLDLR